MTVLILHGSMHVSSRLSHRLSTTGYVTVVSGAQGAMQSVRLIAEFKPELVILDAELEGGAGLEVLRKVKSFDSPPRIIMTSSSPYTQYRLECFKGGADFYFQLPAEIEELSDAISELSAAQPDRQG